MIRKIGTFKFNPNVQEAHTMNQINSKQIEESFANLGKALKQFSDTVTAQGVFGLALNDFDAVANRLNVLDTDLVWKIQEAAADLALVADMELKSRGV